MGKVSEIEELLRQLCTLLVKPKGRRITGAVSECAPWVGLRFCRDMKGGD
jgi:hypothetical protein